MNELSIKFITDIVKPWEEINQSLSQPYAINPKISDFTRTANSLAIAIKHLAELNGLKVNDLEKESQAYKIMSDVADGSKHGALRDANRNNTLTVGSMFEGNESGQFRFLRNVINITHNTYGKVDFIKCSKDAALFLMKKLNIKTDWQPVIRERAEKFVDEVRLHANPRHQVAWTCAAPSTSAPCSPPSIWRKRLTSSGRYWALPPPSAPAHTPSETEHPDATFYFIKT